MKVTYMSDFFAARSERASQRRGVSFGIVGSLALFSVLFFATISGGIPFTSFDGNFALQGTPSAQAQSLADKFGGFSTNSNDPIDIEADQLKVNDIKKTAIFSGNVKARQGNFVLRSKFLEVYYTGTPAAGAKSASGANGKVKKLSAKGKVLISTKDQQSATSEWAEFDVIKQTIILGDEVILTQGGNIIKGGRLIIDLKTRQSRFENKNKKTKGRVQMKVDVGQKLKEKK